MSYVYVMGTVGADLFKIGIADNPLSRMRDLQTACPYRLTLAYVIECPDKYRAYRVETWLHGMAFGVRTYGEFGKAPICRVVELTDYWMSKHEQFADCRGRFVAVIPGLQELFGALDIKQVKHDRWEAVCPFCQKELWYTDWRGMQVTSRAHLKSHYKDFRLVIDGIMDGSMKPEKPYSYGRPKHKAKWVVELAVELRELQKKGYLIIDGASSRASARPLALPEWRE